MPHHVLRNKDLREQLAVVDQKCNTHKLRDYRTSSRPGLYWLARTRFNLLIDLDDELVLNERSFFQRSSHIQLLDSAVKAGQALTCLSV